MILFWKFKNPADSDENTSAPKWWLNWMTLNKIVLSGVIDIYEQRKRDTHDYEEKRLNFFHPALLFFTSFSALGIQKIWQLLA